MLLGDLDISNFERFTRFGITQLPGTEIEINSVKNIFDNNNWLTSISEGVLANETKIKNVNSPQVLHIATHGFLLSNKKNEFDPIAQLMGIDKNKIYDHPLMRSGLLLERKIQ